MNFTNFLPNTKKISENKFLDKSGMKKNNLIFTNFRLTNKETKEKIEENKNKIFEKNFDQRFNEKCTAAFISKLTNCDENDPYFYIKSFSEKAISTLEEIFKNYEKIGIRYFNQIKDEEFLKNKNF